VVYLGSAFVVIWFASLLVFQASGRGIHLLLLVPIISFVLRAWQERGRF